MSYTAKETTEGVWFDSADGKFSAEFSRNGNATLLSAAADNSAKSWTTMTPDYVEVGRYDIRGIAHLNTHVSAAGIVTIEKYVYNGDKSIKKLEYRITIDSRSGAATKEMF